MKRKRIIAFIPVRGGSKGIPGKNIKPLAGKPLVCYGIDAALNTKAIDKVVISTESQEIRAVIDAYYGVNNKIGIFDRDPSTATDTASTESAMLDYGEKHSFDHVILIQATSPLISSEDINGGIQKYLGGSFGGLLSVVRQKRFTWSEDGPLNYDPQFRPRRQDFDGFLVENGAFYITSRENLLKTRCRMTAPYGVYEMPEDSYFEIDEPEDWLIVEGLIKKRIGQSTNLTLNEKIKKIKLVLTDVDGALTDAGMYYAESGDELKKFNTRDGKGMELLRKAGYKVGIITAENTRIVENRAKKLKVDFLFQGAENKLQIVKKLANDLGIGLENIAYMGDDLNDLEVIKHVGLSACPADAVKQIKDNATFISSLKGGEGCFRELVNILLN